jgi:hypothetical protein
VVLKDFIHGFNINFISNANVKNVVGFKRNKMTKKKDDRTFSELLDYHEGNILKHLLRGTLRDGVFLAIEDASKWGKRNG